MSSYLMIKAKPKGYIDKEYSNYPVLLCLCTSPARELASDIDLPLTVSWDDKEDESTWKELSNDKLTEIIDYYNNEIKAHENILNEYNEQYAQYLHIVQTSKNTAFCKSILKEDMPDLKERIDWLKKDIEDMKYLKDKFLFISNILDENENFDLVYYLD